MSYPDKTWCKFLDCKTHTESLPLYRHKELYEWNKIYQTHKFFTEKDFEEESRIEELKRAGWRDYSNAHNEEYSPEPAEELFRYEDRYYSLKQNTVFVRNLHTLGSIRWDVESYSEYVLKSAIRGIDKKFVNFELLYVWFAKRRCFSYDYWDDDYKSFPNDNYNQWLKFCDMRKEAFKNRHLNCCKYRQFIEHEFK